MTEPTDSQEIEAAELAVRGLAGKATCPFCGRTVPASLPLLSTGRRRVVNSHWITRDGIRQRCPGRRLVCKEDGKGWYS